MPKTEGSEPESIQAKCHRCEYEWTTKGKHYYVPCPRCHTLVSIRKLPPIKKE